jgi:hypothetical protein
MKSFKQYITEELITPSTAPGTMSFWHGGNLENGPSEDFSHSKGRFEYAPGLYLTTSYNVVEKYKKGSRKLYMVTIKKGVDIDDIKISIGDATNFVNRYVSRAKRGDVMYYIEKRNKEDGYVDGGIFLNILINNEAIKASQTGILKDFLVQQRADYSIVDNAFGWGERMIVLFNNKLITNIQRVNPKDKIETYDLPTEWS